MQLKAVTSVFVSHFHAIAMPGVLWCLLRSCSVASELDLPALSRSRNAPETAGFVYVLAGFALAPPTGVEPVTFGLGNRTSLTSSPTHKFAHQGNSCTQVHHSQPPAENTPKQWRGGYRLVLHKATQAPTRAARECCPLHYPAPPRHWARCCWPRAELEKPSHDLCAESLQRVAERALRFEERVRELRSFADCACPPWVKFHDNAQP